MARGPRQEKGLVRAREQAMVSEKATKPSPVHSPLKTSSSFPMADDGLPLLTESRRRRGHEKY